MRLSEILNADASGLEQMSVIDDVKKAGNLLPFDVEGQHIKGDFNVKEFRLTSLKGSPKIVDGQFIANDNELVDLISGPEHTGDFLVHNNRLESLVGSPKTVKGKFVCGANPSLTTLEGITPTIAGSLFFTMCNFTTLHDIHKHVKSINGSISVYKNPIKECVLGLLLIDGLTRVMVETDATGMIKSDRILSRELAEALSIANKYLPNHSRSDLIKCQNEMLDAGLDDFARI